MSGKETRGLLVEKLSKKWDTNIFRLRQQFIGAVVDENKLQETGLKRADQSDVCTKWELTWKSSCQEKLVVHISKNGIIYHMELYEYLDLQVDDYIGAAFIEGWHLLSICKEQREKQLRHALESSLKTEVNTSAKDSMAAVIKNFGLSIDGCQDEIESFPVCCCAYSLIADTPSIARLICCLLIRHIQEINDYRVIDDLPYLAGRLGLLPECCYSLLNLLEKNKEIQAPIWTNCGAVLCDNVREAKLAFECFKEAIYLNQNLGPPRQAIWIAGNETIRQLLIADKYEETIDCFEELIELGGQEYANHGTFIFAGLAYEMLDRGVDAKRAYEKALRLELGIQLAENGLNRLAGSDVSPFDTVGNAIQRLTEDTAFNNKIPEDRYLW